MSTTTAPQSRSKPAVKRDPEPPPPTPDRVLIHAKVDAIARSRMQTDARLIVKKAKELLELLEAFGEEHTGDSIAAEVKKTGVGMNDQYLREMAKNLLYDAQGGVYAIESFVSFFGSDLLDENAGDLSDIAAKSR